MLEKFAEVYKLIMEKNRYEFNSADARPLRNNNDSASKQTKDGRQQYKRKITDRPRKDLGMKNRSEKDSTGKKISQANSRVAAKDRNNVSAEVGGDYNSNPHNDKIVIGKDAAGNPIIGRKPNLVKSRRWKRD